MADIFYKYYKLYPSHEHYLFAKELCEKIGIYSRKNKPHTKFFCDLYDSLVPADEEKLYYHTHNGMVRVFPDWNTIFRVIDIIANEIDKNTLDKDEEMHEFVYNVNDMEYIVRADIHKARTAAFLLRQVKEEAFV